MDNSTPISADKKRVLQQSLADSIMKGLGEGTLSVEDSELSAQFMLDEMDSILYQENLITFLDSLSARWPYYKYLLTQELEMKAKKDDFQQINQAITELKEMTQ